MYHWDIFKEFCKNSKVILSLCDLYLSHSTVILNLDFNSSSNVFSYSFGKVTKGKNNLQPVTLNFKSDGAFTAASASNAGLPP